VTLQNQVDWTNQTVLFRRIDLVESSYQQDMNVNGVSLTQFMQTDAYNTVAIPATVAAYPITIAGNTITATGAASLHNLHDYIKYWLTQNMAIANFMAANGTTEDVTAYNIAGLQNYSKSSKITAVKSSGVINSIGAFTVDVIGNVTQATPTALSGVTVTGDLAFNTNTPITVIYSGPTTVTGTVSNSGTALVTITLADGSTIGTVGTNVVTRIQTELVLTGLTAGSQIYVADSTGAQVDYVTSSGTSYTLDTTGGTGEWTYKVARYGFITATGTFTPATASFTFAINLVADSNEVSLRK
jgi:hypothetical protein